jgi:hypothetical protein
MYYNNKKVRSFYVACDCGHTKSISGRGNNNEECEKSAEYKAQFTICKDCAKIIGVKVKDYDRVKHGILISNINIIRQAKAANPEFDYNDPMHMTKALMAFDK